MGEITMTDAVKGAAQPSAGTEALIRRHMEIRREIATDGTKVTAHPASPAANVPY